MTGRGLPQYRSADVVGFVFSSIAFLSRDANRGYGTWPIPHARDAQISGVLKDWIALAPSEREESASTVSEEQCFTLLAYSERMASLAVREGDEECLLLGLVAAGIAPWHIDSRENTLILSLHFDAASRMNSRPDLMFEKAAALLPELSANALRLFLRRSARDKSIEAMGYVAAKGDGGFRYRRAW